MFKKYGRIPEKIEILEKIFDGDLEVDLILDLQDHFKVK